MRKTGLEPIQEISRGGRIINNLRYPDYTTLISGKLDDKKLSKHSQRN